jgi:putative transposase
VTFAFIAAEKAKDQTMNIAWACRTLGVSTSGFYEWRTAQVNPCQRHREDDQLRATIRDIHRRSRGTYGAPRVHAELRLGLDIRVGRKRVERLMRAEDLQGVTRRRRRGLTRRDAAAVPNDDLVARQFTPDHPDRLWVADITEHPSDEGRVYLAVVIDAWNRQVIGHSIADHLRAELVVDALDMACWRRRPVAGQTVHHSDHGTQTRLNRSKQHRLVAWSVGAGRRLRRACSIRGSFAACR